MTLTELIAAVKRVTGHDPGLEAYDDDIRDVMNEVYLQMATSQVWRWAVKEVDFEVHAPVSVSGLFTLGDTLITLTSGTAAIWMRHGFLTVNGKKYLLNAAEPGPGTLYLEEPWDSVTGAYDGVVSEDTVPLPRDCHQPYLFYDETQQELFGSMTQKERDFFIGRGAQLPAGWVLEAPQHFPAPTDAMTAAQVASALPDPVPNGSYELAYSYVYRGVESSLWTLVQQAIIGIVPSIMRLTLAARDRGIRVRIYGRITGTTAWYLVRDDVAEGLTTIDLLGSELSWWQKKERHFPDSGTPLLRFVPPTSQTYAGKLRYIGMPLPLLEPGDSPVFPAASHIWLRHATLEELYSRHDNMAKSRNYATKAADVLNIMAAREKTDDYRTWERQSSGFNFTARGYGVTIPPNITVS